MGTAIIFFHEGTIPFYLKCAIESARFFNPEVPIYLISDVEPSLSLEWRIKCIHVEDSRHSALDEFVRNYRHISSSKFDYERRCFERWFYFQKIISDFGINEAVILDSDTLIFSDVSPILSLLPEHVNFACSKGGGPAMTLIRGSLEPFLRHMMERFLDNEYLDAYAIRMEAARSRKRMDNLTDMTICEEFSTSNDRGFVYSNQNHVGHIDHGLWLPDGMDFRRVGRRQRKRVFWRDEGGVMQPYFRTALEWDYTKALCIHFQSKAKKMVRRFNRLGTSGLNSGLGRSFRAWYYNILMN